MATRKAADRNFFALLPPPRRPSDHAAEVTQSPAPFRYFRSIAPVLAQHRISPERPLGTSIPDYAPAGPVLRISPECHREGVKL